MSRKRRTVSLATCAGCEVVGPARCVARRHGWRHRGPQQRRRWYCPTCEPPAPPLHVPALPIAATSLPVEPPTEPFVRLRWERDRAAREQAATHRDDGFSITAALAKLLR